MWELRGTESQNRIVQDALKLCDFPFERLVDSLREQTGGRVTIPVEWADLSTAGANAARGAEEWGKGHPIEARSAVLGLAWSNGRVQLDVRLEGDARLGHEVFLSEGAHMVDFFYMTDPDRAAVTAALHPDGGNDGHAWFDQGSYESWVGEAFMGQFVAAFAPAVGVTLTQFLHRPTVASTSLVRQLLLREEAPGAPDVPATPFPYEQLDRWAARVARWWPKYQRDAVSAYLEWKKSGGE